MLSQTSAMPAETMKDNLRYIRDIPLHPTDTLILTYPKSGTTWLQYIGLQLLKGVDFDMGQGSRHCAFLEVSSRRVVEECPHPRLFKTHYDLDNIPWSSGAKYIFCVRNPKDVVVSYYHHYCNIKHISFEGTFDEFFQMFLDGTVLFGCYFEHLLSFLRLADQPNVLFLKYEDMLEDLEGAVKKIGLFVGGATAKLVNNREELETVVRNSSFNAMKEKEDVIVKSSNVNKPGNFLREGKKGGWRRYLSREQSDLLDAVFQRKLGGTDAAKWWREEMSWY